MNISILRTTIIADLHSSLVYTISHFQETIIHKTEKTTKITKKTLIRSISIKASFIDKSYMYHSVHAVVIYTIFNIISIVSDSL